MQAPHLCSTRGTYTHTYILLLSATCSEQLAWWFYHYYTARRSMLGLPPFPPPAHTNNREHHVRCALIGGCAGASSKTGCYRPSGDATMQPDSS